MYEEIWLKVRKSTFFKLGVTVGVSYVLYLLAPFLLPIVLAIALAFLLYPLAKFLSTVQVTRGKVHISRVLSIILSIVCFCALLFMVVSIFVLPLLGQINSLLLNYPELRAGLQGGNVETVIESAGKIKQLPSSMESLVSFSMQWAIGALAVVLRNLVTSSLEIVRSLIGLVIVPFLTFYFLKDWKELRTMVIEFFNPEVQEKVADCLDEIGRTLSAYATGLGKLSLLSAIVISCGTAALGVGYPMVLGFWALLAETVPVVGPLMGAIPAIFLAYGVSVDTAVYTAIFYVVYYQLDANVIMPKIMGDKVQLKPVVIIICLLIGAKLFGIIGMIFAIPVAAVYRVLYDKLWHA